MSDQLQGKRIRRWTLHLLGILALMWPALVNGQPFFFPDTTAYVRAADLAVQLASRHRIRTAWSRPEASQRAAVPAQPGGAPAKAVVHISDAQNGDSAMAGRSPYFGMLLYLGWVTSGFWLFVLGQAVVAWWLIGLAQRATGRNSLRFRLGLAVGLALLTPLSVYLGLLLADALAGFGILAFLILVRPPPDLARWEKVALVLLLLMSAAAHFTHIVIIAGMTGLLGLLAMTRLVPWRSVRGATLIGASVTFAGLLSVMATSLIVAKALGRPPVAVPVLTARFIVDGPGQAFANAGCGGRHFAACDRHVDPLDTDLWLWSNDPHYGAFVTADPATRDRMSAEDGGFALAVLRAYPLRQGGMMAWNTWKQLTLFDSLVLRERCLADQGCGGLDIPEKVRATMARTPAGRNLWPMALMSAVHAAITIAALLLLVVAMRRLRARQPEAARLFLLWIALTAAAFLINDFLGGAISNPQTRYQERIVWIVPLLAILAAARAWSGLGFLRPIETVRPAG